MRRNLNSMMMELLRDGRSSIWDAFDPILSNVRAQAIRFVTLDCELKDIESYGIDTLQERLCRTPFLHLEQVRFNVVCEGRDDLRRRPMLSPLWSMKWERLRKQHHTDIVFCQKADVDTIF